MIDCNWASFVTLCHHQNTNKCCHSLSVSDLLSVNESVSLSSATSPDLSVRSPPRPSRPIDITFVQSNCSKLRNTTFVILQNPFKIIATTFASHGTCRNLKTEMINRDVKTRGLFTHPQPSAINSNLHNTSHNEAPRSRLVFSTCFDDVFRGNSGDIPYDAAHVVNAGWHTPD